SAYKAWRLGLLNDVVACLRHDGRIIPNPAVVTSGWTDHDGRIEYGEFLTGEELAAGRRLIQAGTIDLTPLDRAVERLATKLLHTMPECLIKTVESLRKKKLEHWHRNSETNRAWLALNMLTEGRAGFQAFNHGANGKREVDFVELRRRLARGQSWDDEMFREIAPRLETAGG
ncbi:MAG: 6-oxocyclohex-1-ene-1-carbonyl-CoA hydratase, partial [Acidobacteria bacterium]|nr:6-oxocyclohex-1-ene-1-carbonyl-CoA hydratase [Acidobacteriota bacterium]